MSEAKKQSCRYYEQQHPEVDDLVMVKVKHITDIGAYVSLLEYNNIEGLILSSELSRKRIRSISQLIRLGRNEVCVVLRVDPEKGYIDLSKSKVAAEDIPKCEEKYNKSKAVSSIMRHLAETTDQDLEELNKLISWPLYRKFGHAFDAFKMTLTNPDQVFQDIEFPDNNTKEQLLSIIQNRLKPQPVKLRADIQVTCYSYEGIEAVKEALSEGEKIGTEEEIDIKITLVAPPLYVMATTTSDKQKGLDTLQASIDKITEIIKKYDGEVTVKAPPRVVNEKDDHSLTVLLENLREQNKEVDGDEEEEYIGM
ncbi:predicted protein [Naegleria gruberi]|uniref:Predicted protein n=1 Tax=Naegleria gruberi TaxID=5762 RepID=D2VM26_NAEGR|nr:uncharacterized protein NAEGRDRAFT_50681 [Naegleria gruberi]EFC42246.1 predicted protein [Naegleria gruberi]|eukprot:XP_002674990.1 predicted protein [Naegleria gruberi strain NEG-M]